MSVYDGCFDLLDLKLKAKRMYWQRGPDYLFPGEMLGDWNLTKIREDNINGD